MISQQTHAHTVQSLFSQPETHKGGHYDVEMKRWMEMGAKMMCKLNGQMGNGGYDDVHMQGGQKKWHYDVQIKMVDGKGREL